MHRLMQTCSAYKRIAKASLITTFMLSNYYQRVLKFNKTKKYT